MPLGAKKKIPTRISFRTATVSEIPNLRLHDYIEKGYSFEYISAHRPKKARDDAFVIRVCQV